MSPTDDGDSEADELDVELISIMEIRVNSVNEATLEVESPDTLRVEAVEGDNEDVTVADAFCDPNCCDEVLASAESPAQELGCTRDVQVLDDECKRLSCGRGVCTEGRGPSHERRSVEAWT